MRSFVPDVLGAPPPANLLPALSWVDIARGREELFRNRLAGRLDHLAANSRVASIRASTEIEGFHVEESRAGAVIAGRVLPRNDDEEALRGYRDALDAMYLDGPERLTPAYLLRVHRQVMGPDVGGRFKSFQNQVVDLLPEGRRRVRFTPPSPAETPALTAELCERYELEFATPTTHPLIAIAAFGLDLLTVHPFEDGNGRVTRLVTNMLLERAGYGVGRYVSLEQEIRRTESAYFAALEQSTIGWNDGRHSLWPWTRYLVAVVSSAYERFEDRVGDTNNSAVTSVQQWVADRAPRRFTRADAIAALPAISPGSITRALAELRDLGMLRLEGVGRGASWVRLASPPTPID